MPSNAWSSYGNQQAGVLLDDALNDLTLSDLHNRAFSAKIGKFYGRYTLIFNQLEYLPNPSTHLCLLKIVGDEMESVFEEKLANSTGDYRYCWSLLKNILRTILKIRANKATTELKKFRVERNRSAKREINHEMCRL